MRPDIAAVAAALALGISGGAGCMDNGDAHEVPDDATTILYSPSGGLPVGYVEPAQGAYTFFDGLVVPAASMERELLAAGALADHDLAPRTISSGGAAPAAAWEDVREIRGELFDCLGRCDLLGDQLRCHESCVPSGE